MYGLPGSGKTTLAQAVAKAMGTYHKTSTPAALLSSTERRSKRAAAVPRLAQRRPPSDDGRDENAMVLDGPIISRLTGGENIQLRDLHGKAFEFTPKFKPLLYGNLPPTISGSAAAIARRVYVAAFQPGLQRGRQLGHRQGRQGADGQARQGAGRHIAVAH